MFVSKKVVVRDGEKGRAIFTRESIVKDEVIIEFEQRFIDEPTGTSMQVDEKRHLEATDIDALENFLNHACKPNGYIDFTILAFRAKRIIEPGEDIGALITIGRWLLESTQNSLVDIDRGITSCLGVLDEGVRMLSGSSRREKYYSKREDLHDDNAIVVL